MGYIRKVKEVPYWRLTEWLWDQDDHCNYCECNDTCTGGVKASPAGPIYPPCVDNPEGIEPTLYDNYRDRHGDEDFQGDIDDNEDTQMLNNTDGK